MDISPAPTLLRPLPILANSNITYPSRLIAPRFEQTHSQPGSIPTALKNLFLSSKTTRSPDIPRDSPISNPFDATIVPGPSYSSTALRHHAFEFTATIEGVGGTTSSGLGEAWIEKPSTRIQSEMLPPASRISSM
jgi:hypothetical protein